MSGVYHKAIDVLRAFSHYVKTGNDVLAGKVGVGQGIRE